MTDAGRGAGPRLSRREVLRASVAASLVAAIAPIAWPYEPAADAGAARVVPADGAPHVRTWMAWPWRRSIWGRQLAGVQRDVALVARTVAEHEPVVVVAPSPARADEARASCGGSVLVLPGRDDRARIRNDDCWMRDTAPVFRVGGGTRDAIGLRFDGWGGDQVHGLDRGVARRVASEAGVDFVPAGFRGEGGAIECDGDGTVMATESSLIGPERNPGRTRAQVEAAILSAYGASKMIWVPGVRGRDITDDHIDATSRFVRPGVVMVQRAPAWRRDVWARDAERQFEILAAATDARGRRLTVLEIEGPDTIRSDAPEFVDSYVNFHLAGDAIVTARFGDSRKDAAARAALRDAFPGRAIVQLDLDHLHAGGGGVHCITMGEPAP